MFLSRPVTEVIRQRFSCRTYLDAPIADDKRIQLQAFLSSLGEGPFGTPVRFETVAATRQDHNALKGLGTYGMIKRAAGFIVGAVQPSGKYLEDYGHLMEQGILYATAMGLGTCWLGGTFTKSRFARRISVRRNEQIPAVTSCGYTESGAFEGKIRQMVGADHRRSWNTLFFRSAFGFPLSREEAGTYAVPLDMVRIGPSASNKQPWRIVQDGDAWHFFLQRTRGYGNSLLFRFLGLADLQRIDMGIAMSHFELTARDLGLKGEWVIRQPDIALPDNMTEYIASWTARP